MAKEHQGCRWLPAMAALAVVAATLLPGWSPDSQRQGFAAPVEAPRPGHVTPDGCSQTLPKVRVSGDGRHFVLGDSGQVFVPWGFNYLGEFGKLTEETWDTDWPRVERDFRGMRKLGANVVRVHLQFGTYMTGPDRFDAGQLDRLKRMLDLAREEGLYLDVTGLSCYRLNNIPGWYDALDEAERWEVQARWWKKIAETCAGHPAVFCYDLMNEPVVPGGKRKDGEWLGGAFAGKDGLGAGTDDNQRFRALRHLLVVKLNGIIQARF